MISYNTADRMPSSPTSTDLGLKPQSFPFLGLATVGILTLAAIACGEPTDPWVDIVTETEGSEFGLVENGTVFVPFSVTNIDSRTHFVAACGDRPATLLDRRQDGRWALYSSTICIAILSSVPIPLRPGERLQSAWWIREAGVYRVRVGVSMSRGESSDWSEVSNSFTVR